ncbi:G-D-S-L family lipolytic protein [Mariniphaga sediminis]|uniref:G-D-S-L family lipolytic protein n=1 Tax=Mariniphaga sediminis TaxID=1628158 RepID=A0A399D3X1_9BACT|nr:GDSL-type esterase/lipase family protein [Mariniphaga sediminis]RIH65421.1 G-D-S-L family lipolytic protein [Mariniphaga sediminis]
MKKILAFSIILNISFLILFSYEIYKKGGSPYLKNKFRSEKPDLLSEKPYWYYKKYQHWKETKSLYDILPNDSNEIVFVGNSITFGCEWAELFSNPKIKNRGIGGDNTEGLLERLTEITESNPDKIFLSIGTNDLALNIRISEICANYEKIINRINKSTPKTKIYIQSVLPTNNHPERNNDSIIVLNNNLKKIADKKSAKYINLFDSFLNPDGNLNMELSFDGLHLKGQGYLIWKKLIESDVKE